MRNLRISDIGLSKDASHAFHSMLAIVQGRAAADWHLSTPAEADVLLAPTQQAAHGAHTRDKTVIVVAEERSEWIDAPFVLRHPFRVMQILSILDAVSAHLQTEPVTACSTHWAGAQSLRALILHGMGDST